MDQTASDVQPWAPMLPEAYLGEDLRIRELPPDEWHRMSEAGGFFEDGEKIPAPTANVRVIVAEQMGISALPGDDTTRWTVVAYWPVFDAVHAEPLHIIGPLRHQPKLGMALFGAMMTLLQKSQVKHVWVTIAPGHHTSEELAAKIGLEPLAGSLWTGRVPTPKGE